MNLDELNKIAQAMVASGKGILAADESSGTIKKRFDAIGVESTENIRRDYREMLFRSAEGMKHISGVILYDETIWQKAKDGTPLVELIKKAGAIPGIKVDEGTKPLPYCPSEVVTTGLDKLSERLPKYYEQGARFAKWRAVIDIGAGFRPTPASVPMRTRWRATPHFVRPIRSCRSSNRKCLWTATTISTVVSSDRDWTLKSHSRNFFPTRRA